MKWAIIGCGNISNKFSENLVSIKNTEISCIASKNINRLKISDDFSFTQICKMISKGLKLESYESLIKSLCLEKGNFFVDINISINDIRLKVDSFLKKNQEISSHFFKGNPINWESVVANIFLKLLMNVVPAKIPVFLIQEKIYFPSDFQQIISKTLDETLEKEFGSSNNLLKVYPCDSYNFKNKAFFSNIFSRKIKCSNRYLNRVSNQRLK